MSRALVAAPALQGLEHSPPVPCCQLGDERPGQEGPLWMCVLIHLGVSATNPRGF